MSPDTRATTPPPKVDLGSLQDIFDKSGGHLLTQGKRAAETEAAGTILAGACRYRTTQGLKCAVGALIPDEAYSRRFEGASIIGNPELLALFGIESDSSEFRLLSRLQNVHDCSEPHSWPGLLSEVASEFSLHTGNLPESIEVKA